MADVQAITDYEIFERTTCTPLQSILTQTTWSLCILGWILSIVRRPCVCVLACVYAKQQQ